MRKERLEAFSDGVIAIIITLMILEIRVPELTKENIYNLIRHISIYGLSFIVLAIIWLNHHSMFLLVERVNIKIMWLNFLLLFFMSLIPLPTKALGQNFFLKDNHLFYGIVLTSTAVSFSLLQNAVNENVISLSAEDKKGIDLKNWISTMLYSLSIPLSFISIYLSLLIFILIPAIFFIPGKKLSNELKSNIS